VELEPPEHAARLGRWQGGIESSGGVGGEVVEEGRPRLLGGVDIEFTAF
jgi:hypothetical protein